MIHLGGKHSGRGPAPIVVHLSFEPRAVPTRRMKGTHFDGRTWPVRLPILAWDTCVTFPSRCAKVANIIVDPDYSRTLYNLLSTEFLFQASLPSENNAYIHIGEYDLR